jgi:diaminobutyrate-2-oxoglutarate transaminase
MEIFETLESNVRSYCRSFPMVLHSAQFHQVVDEHGRHYIDFFSAAGSLNYGHNPECAVSAVVDYLKSNGIVSTLDMYSTAKRDFLTSFNDVILVPRKLDYRIQFTGPTGANAVEAALKIARMKTKRSNVIAFTNAYHGLSLGALSLTGNREKRDAAGIALGGVTRFPFEGYMPGVDTLGLLEKMLDDPSSGVDLPAAIIFESIQAEGGLNTASIQWMQRLNRIARERGILLIADEIQTGCGRSGRFFSFEEAGIVPDIVTLSKSLGGIGLPIAVVLMKPELDIWKPGQHNGTFRGNNLAFVAARAVIETYWKSADFVRGLTTKVNLLDELLIKIRVALPKTFSFELAGRGLLRGLRFDNPETAALVQAEALRNGLIVETCGPRDEVVKLLPCITIEEEALKQGLAILEAALKSVQHQSSVREISAPVS